MRLGTAFKLAVVAAIVLVVALVAVGKSIDGERYRQVLTQAAKIATGRDLQIRGRVRLLVSLTPSLVAEDIVLANAPWGSRPDMLRLKEMRAELGLVPLLFREVAVHKLVFVEPDLLLERDAKGRGNWEFPTFNPDRLPLPSSAGTPTRFHLEHVLLDGGRVEWRDGHGGSGQSLDIATLTADADTLISPIGVKLAGRWNDRPVDLSAVLGSPSQLLAPAQAARQPNPVKLKIVMPGLVTTFDGTVTADKADDPALALKLTADAADLGELAGLLGLPLPPLGAGRLVMSVSGRPSAPVFTEIDAALGRKAAIALTAKGSIKRPLEGRGVNLLLAAEGASLAGFNKSWDLDLPAAGPIAATARLSDVDGGWRLGDLKVRLGRSDLSGDVALRTDGPRPQILAHLASAVVDADELELFRTEPPAAAAGTDQLFSDRVFSGQPLPFARLLAVDGRVEWRIDLLSSEAVAAHQVALQATLTAGRLSVEQSIDALANGHATGSVTIDAAAQPPRVAVSLDSSRVDLGDVLGNGKWLEGLQGARSDIHLALRGTGVSPRAIMARLNGEASLVTDRVRFGDGIAAELLHQLDPAAGTGEADLHCLVSRFVVTDGLAKSEALIFDTPGMTVSGQGSIQLGNETLDLTLMPQFKDLAQTGRGAALDIGGTLAAPMVGTTSPAAIVRTPDTAIGTLAQGLGQVPVAGGSDDTNPCLAALAPSRRPAPPHPVKPKP